MTGLESDLRTGLPSQMTDIHDPLRLLCVIEQDPDVVQNVIDTTPAIAEWIRNSWVRVAAFDPRRSKFYFFNVDRFKEVDIT